MTVAFRSVILGLLIGCGSGFGDLTAEDFQQQWTPPAFRADHIDLSLPAGETMTFTVDVEEGTDVLYVAMRGGTGDPDLYVLAQDEDGNETTLCHSIDDGSEESCVVWDPPVGEVTVRVDAYTAFEGVELDFEFGGGDTVVPEGDPLVIARPHPNENGRIAFTGRVTNRHGSLRWEAPTARDGSLGTPSYYWCNFDDIDSACSVSHPTDTLFTARASGAEQPATLTWTPAPLIFNQVVEGSATVVIEAEFDQVFIESEDRDIRISRGGIVLCDNVRRCTLQNPVVGEYSAYSLYPTGVMASGL